MHPEFAAAAFDTPVPTFRHREFEPTRRSGHPRPRGLPSSLAGVQLLDALGIPIYRVDGFEADDLLGTLTNRRASMGLEVVIVTGDTDALQLVAPGVCVLTSRRGFTDTVLYDERGVQERYGVEPPATGGLQGAQGGQLRQYPRRAGHRREDRLQAGRGARGPGGHLRAPGAAAAKAAPAARRPPRSGLLLAPPGPDRQRRSRRAGPGDLPAWADTTARRVVELFRELGFRSLLDRLPRGS